MKNETSNQNLTELEEAFFLWQEIVETHPLGQKHFLKCLMLIDEHGQYLIRIHKQGPLDITEPLVVVEIAYKENDVNKDFFVSLIEYDVVDVDADEDYLESLEFSNTNLQTLNAVSYLYGLLPKLF